MAPKVLAVNVMAHQMLLLHKASHSANAMIKNEISTPNLKRKSNSLESNKTKVLQQQVRFLLHHKKYNRKAIALQWCETCP